MVVTLIFLAVLIGGMVIGMPIAQALVLTGVALMWHLDFFDSQLLAQNLQAGFDNFPLLAVPFFILAGELMNAGGLSRRIIDLARAYVGHIRGGLGYVAIGAAVLLASMSGSAIADTAALATILLPMMREQKYPDSYSAGLLASGGIIAPIIPPSMPFVIYGVTTNTSISKLFLSGVVPGLISTVIFALPAPIRLTHLGISSVPKQLLEAGESFGATKGQLLWKIELPHALPTIMAGLTQCIMLSLSMVVIAALVGADGLGKPVVRALNTVNIAKGFEAGLAIVIVAILLDRICRRPGAGAKTEG